MRRLGPLLPLALLACGRMERIDSYAPPSPRPDASSAETAVIVQDAGANLPTPDAGFQSALHVPTDCPVYAPGGGNVDTPEPPFPSPMTALCVVDDTGGSYGVVLGDAPTAHRTVVPGKRELGLYLGFDPQSMFLSDRSMNDVWGPPLRAQMTCCSPSRMVTLIPQLVAQDKNGVLVSLGPFDGGPQEITFFVDLGGVLGTGETIGMGGFVQNFYVNAAPP